MWKPDQGRSPLIFPAAGGAAEPAPHIRRRSRTPLFEVISASAKIPRSFPYEWPFLLLNCAFTSEEKMMLKALVIFVAVIIAVVNVTAQSSSARRQVVRKAGVVRIGPSSTYLKQGLTTEEVVRLLGEPTSITDGGTSQNLVTYEFQRSEGRVLVAEFVGGTLVSSHTVVRTNGQVGR
jgi:hypothetical protein